MAESKTARPPKGKSLTYRGIRLDDDVWAECQELRKTYGTINEVLAAGLAALRMLPPPVADGMVNQGRGNQNPDEPLLEVVSREVRRQVQSWKRGPRPKGDKTR